MIKSPHIARPLYALGIPSRGEVKNKTAENADENESAYARGGSWRFMAGQTKGIPTADKFPLPFAFRARHDDCSIIYVHRTAK